MCFAFARIAKGSVCYMPNDKQDLLEDKLSIFSCHVAQNPNTGHDDPETSTSIYSVEL